MTDMNNGSDAISDLLSAILHEVTRVADAVGAPDHNTYCENGCSVNPDEADEPADDGLDEWERELLRPVHYGDHWREDEGCAYCDSHTSDGRCKYPKTCESEGTHKPAPDDLPGEPVEPGGLRAGDKVEFTYKGERITGTCTFFEVGALDIKTLRSDAPNSGGYRPYIVFRGEWANLISGVRLIERAPREDEDEALAKALSIANEEARWDRLHPLTRARFRDLARAAREHVEAEFYECYAREDATAHERAEKAEQERDFQTERADSLGLKLQRAEAERDDYEGDFCLQRDLAGEAEAERDEWREVAKSFEDGRDKWQARWREVDEARERAEAERDEWKARYKALRAALGVQE